MADKSKYYQMVAEAIIAHADPIYDAIDRYLAKADEDLEDELKEEGYAENTPDPVDAAAKYALRHGFNKKVKEVSFQNWQLLTAENMLCDLAS